MFEVETHEGNTETRSTPKRVPADFDGIVKALVDKTARPITVRILRTTPEGGQANHESQLPSAQRMGTTEEEEKEVHCSLL